MATSTIPHNMHIEKGAKTTDTNGKIEVTFSNAFGSAPYVVCNGYGSSTTGVIGVKITSRSATGFTATATSINNGSSSIGPASGNSISWIAIGD